MRVGIIGYGSMGKMLLWKFSEAANMGKQDLLVSNRTAAKLEEAKDIARAVSSKELAASADIVFVCVRPVDLKAVLEEIKDSIKTEEISEENMECIVEILDDISSKIEQKKKPGIIKTALIGLKDFALAAGANITAALIAAKIQGLF